MWWGVGGQDVDVRAGLQTCWHVCPCLACDVRAGLLTCWHVCSCLVCEERESAIIEVTEPRLRWEDCF